MTVQLDDQLESLVAARREAMLLAEMIADFAISGTVITPDLKAEYRAARAKVDQLAPLPGGQS